MSEINETTDKAASPEPGMDLIFGLRKDLLTATQQRQFEYGKWLLASLLAVHLGSLFVISQSGTAAAPLFRSCGSYLIYGVALTLLAGGLAWINFTTVAIVYGLSLSALIEGKAFKLPKAKVWLIRATLYVAPLIALMSLFLFFLAARTAIDVLNSQISGAG